MKLSRNIENGTISQIAAIKIHIILSEVNRVTPLKQMINYFIMLFKISVHRNVETVVLLERKELQIKEIRGLGLNMLVFFHD